MRTVRQSVLIILLSKKKEGNKEGHSIPVLVVYDTIVQIYSLVILCRNTTCTGNSQDVL